MDRLDAFRIIVVAVGGPLLWTLLTWPYGGSGRSSERDAPKRLSDGKSPGVGSGDGGSATPH